MNLKKLLVTLLLPLVIVSQSWTSVITKDINSLRKEYSLPKIVYNYSLHQELIKIVDNSWSGIFYEQNHTNFIKFPFNRTNKNRGYHMHPLGSYTLCHDTIAKPDRIKLIIKQRIQAKSCLAKNCTGDNWTSCFKDPSYENLFGKSKSKCLFAHHYLLKFLLKDLKYIACVTLDYLTGYSPIYQEYSFWCFSNVNWYSQKSSLIKI